MSLTRRMIFACEGDWRALSAVWGGKGHPGAQVLRAEGLSGFGLDGGTPPLSLSDRWRYRS